jgi:hypothetical protein
MPPQSTGGYIFFASTVFNNPLFPKKIMSEQNQGDKNTPSDNRGQKAQNSNMQDTANPKSSGATDFDETQREARQGRETGLNESGNENRPTRDRDGVESNNDKRPGRE